MSTTDLISPDLKTMLRRLKLSPILDTLPERLALARQQKMAHQDFLLLVLADEAPVATAWPLRCACNAHASTPPCSWNYGIAPRASPTITLSGTSLSRCASSNDTPI